MNPEQEFSVVDVDGKPIILFNLHR